MPLGGRTPASILCISFCALIPHLSILKILFGYGVMRIAVSRDAYMLSGLGSYSLLLRETWRACNTLLSLLVQTTTPSEKPATQTVACI